MMVVNLFIPFPRKKADLLRTGTGAFEERIKRTKGTGAVTKRRPAAAAAGKKKVKRRRGRSSSSSSSSDSSSDSDSSDSSDSREEIQ